jgi:hypothetical protein
MAVKLRKALPNEFCNVPTYSHTTADYSQAAIKLSVSLQTGGHLPLANRSKPMANYSDVQIIENDKRALVPALILRQRTDAYDYNLITTLKIVWHGDDLQIQIGIDKEYPKRTTYTSACVHCRPDIANMIAEACRKRVTA